MHVEFLGVSRDRAGLAEIDVQAATLGQLLGALAARMPALAELIVVDRLHPSLAANLHGDRFICHPETPLGDDDPVLMFEHKLLYGSKGARAEYRSAVSACRGTTAPDS